MLSGGTPTTTVSKYWNGGIKWVSPKDFDGGPVISSSELDISEEGRSAARLDILPPGTVVMVVRSGVLAHTLPVAVLAAPATINQDIKALKLRPDVDPKYLTYYLNIHQDTLLPLIRKHGATVQSVNTPELLNLRLPLPPLKSQRHLVADLEFARAERDRALAEADGLLTSFEAWALPIMGLKKPEVGNRSNYAIRLKDARARLDPFYHSPEFMAIEHTLSGRPHARLGELVRFSSETWNVNEHDDLDFRYIEISGVDRRRGRAEYTTMHVHDAPSRARMVVQPDDIIVSLTRPHHGSIALLNHNHKGCIASTGFGVIREVDTQRVHRVYLWAALRLSISLKQMLRRSSGGNYPAITQDELANVLIPLPNLQDQHRIAEEIIGRNREFDRLETYAMTLWRNACKSFEKALIDGATG
jgi:hypothetical protein